MAGLTGLDNLKKNTSTRSLELCLWNVQNVSNFFRNIHRIIVVWLIFSFDSAGLKDEMRVFEIDKVTSRRTIEKLLEEYSVVSKWTCEIIGMLN